MTTTQPHRKDFPSDLEYKKAWYKYKRATDIRYKYLSRIYSHMSQVISNIRQGKLDYISPYLQCDMVTFVKHCESQFKKDFTWDNYGTVWEFDHKISLVDAFRDSGLEGMLDAAVYTNVNPCLIEKNRGGKKGKAFVRNEILEETSSTILIKVVGNGPYPTLLLDKSWKKILKKTYIFWYAQGGSCYVANVNNSGHPINIMKMLLGDKYKKCLTTFAKLPTNDCTTKGLAKVDFTVKQKRTFRGSTPELKAARQKRAAYANKICAMHRRICKKLREEFKLFQRSTTNGGDHR